MGRLCCTGGSLLRRGTTLTCYTCGTKLTEAGWAGLGWWRAKLNSRDSMKLSKRLLAVFRPYKRFCSERCYIIFQNGKLARLSEQKTEIRKKLQEVMRSVSAAEYHVVDAHPSLAQILRDFRKEVETEFWSIVTNG